MENREIKFRRAFYFDEAKTKFSHFQYWGFRASAYRDLFTSPGTNNKAIYHHDDQYIELNDKEGNELYEGDFYQMFNGRTCLIKWDGDHACFYAEYIESGRAIKTFGLTTIDNLNAKKIGSIHENPELLK